jgi:hypothetical protein
MFKSTIVKWAVVAAMAVPAIPALGTTIHHRLVRRTHRPLVVQTHHRLVIRIHRHVVLTAHRKLSTHRLTTHRLVARPSVRHTTASTSSNHFKVHVTKMPPTIDGINT